MGLGKMHFLALATLVAPLLLNACANSSNSTPASTGGTGSGGTHATGGATGGTPSSGGTSSTGGTSAAGGTAQTGGTSAAGGTAQAGGTSSTGGATQAGGSSSTGGMLSTGGTSSGGGTGRTGGTSATGGTGESGGTSAGGGTGRTGGTSAGGGTGRTGGATATGGTGRTGGATATGGSSSTGGSTSCDVTSDVTAALYPNGLTLTKACSPYMVAGFSVHDGGVLTIDAGVTLKFDFNTVIQVGYTGAGHSGTGKLVANGTATDKITLTSQTGLSTDEGWYGIEFWDGTASGSQVTYTTIEYAGGNDDAAIVGESVMPAGLVTLDHVDIKNLIQTDATGIMETDPGAEFVVTNCTLNGVPYTP